MSDPIQIASRLTESGALSNLSPPLQMVLVLSSLTLLPALLVCITPFTRIVIVLSFVRRAVTAQDIPPNTVLTGLSLFMTLFVMRPTLTEIDAKALTPYLDKKINGGEAIDTGGAIMKKFMLRQTRRQDLALFLHMAGMKSLQKPADTPLEVLVPAFMISELKTAFIMGFCIFMPFLLVDLVVSSLLNAMGMMMMPPVTISAPFKVLLFVLADGWHLAARALAISFG
jgi:flagellar biosynthesis protein FliP